MTDSDPHVADVVKTPPAPEGTVALGFWQRAGTRTAIVTTIGSLLAVAKAAIVGVPLSPETLAAMLEVNVWAWLTAGGIAAVSPGAIRRA